MARFPKAVWRPIASATDPQITPIGVVLHVDAGNARSLFDWFNGPSKGIESHFHVAKDGYTEQYRDTEQEADANYHGNSFELGGKTVGFISVETQGYFDGVWTDAQLARIKEILVWARDTHGIPLEECQAWNDPGVGYHVMWGAPGAWTPVAGKTCPGPRRIDQFYNDIVPWMEGAEVKQAQPDWLPDEVIERLKKHKYLTYTPTAETEDIWRMFAFMDRMDGSLRRAIKAAAATGGVTAAAVIAEIVARLT